MNSEELVDAFRSWMPDIDFAPMNPRLEAREPGAVALVLDGASSEQCERIQRHVRNVLPLPVDFFVESRRLSATAVARLAQEKLYEMLPGDAGGDVMIEVVTPDDSRLVVFSVVGVADKYLRQLEERLKLLLPERIVEVHGPRKSVEIAHDIERMGKAVRGILDGG